jgi:hypothetical protein
MKPDTIKAKVIQALFFAAITFSLIVILPADMKGQGPQYYYTGTSTTANTIPFATAATGTNKRQWIYYASNFAGAPAGMITKIYIKASAMVNPSFSGFLIRMGNTTLSTFPSTTFIATGLDTALYAPSVSFTGVTGNWIPMQLTNPWFYDGVSNFIIEASHQGFTTGFSVMQQTSGVTARSLFGNSGSATGSSQDRLAELGFDIQPGSSDIGLEGFVNPPDSICEGMSQVVVTLKNFGPNTLGTAKIGWSVNNVAQTTFNWNGNLAANTTATVILGSYPLVFGNNYAIQAYSFNPNGGNDTIHTNDTILKPSVYIKSAPSFTLTSTNLTMCQGDSVQITGTFSGSPPWNFKLNDGTSTYQISNYQLSSFSQWVKPTLTTTYSVFEISDASGCTRYDTTQITVIVSFAPPAVVTPVGSTGACFGDSVMLMGSVGLNFTYEWYKDATLIPGVSNYVIAAKESGNYTVQIISPNGCKTMSQPVTVTIHPLPVVNLGNDTVLTPNKNITLNAGIGYTSYLWSNGATTQQTTIDTAGSGTGVKTVWVQVTDNYGCVGSDTIKINFTSNPGIAGTTDWKPLKIVPNPSNGIIELQHTGIFTGNLLLEVFNLNGSCILSRKINTTEKEGPVLLDLSHLPNGTYQLKASSEQGAWIGNVIIIQ